MMSLGCRLTLQEDDHVHQLHDPSDSQLVQDYEKNFQLYWGSIPRAMFTLINLMLVAENAEVLRPIFYSDAFVFMVILLFLFFTLFVILNVLVGLIMDHMMQANEELKKEE